MTYVPLGLVQDPQVAAELLQISRAIADLQARIYPKIYAEPDKLQDGMVVFADGTTWDPGSGEGLYRYDLSGDTWVSLEDGGGGGGSVVVGDVDAEASTDGYVITSDGAGNAAWELVVGSDGADGADGDTGAAGNSVAVLNCYKRMSTPAGTPTGGQYVFDTQTLTPPTGWSVSPPAVDGDPLYVSTTVAEINGITGTDTTLTWSLSAIMVTDGATGGVGLNSATISLYHKNTSAGTPPAAFSGTFTYTFATAVLSAGTLNGWAQDAPDIVAGEYLWVRQAAAVANTATDSVPTAEFSGAVVVGVGGEDGADGSDGGAGTDGLHNAIVFLYHKNTNSSSPPSSFAGTFTYTFATAVLSGGSLNGWAQTAPDIVAGEYLWLAQASASNTTATDDVPTAEFSTPAVIAIGGTDGDTALSSYYANIYRRAASAPSTPSVDDGQYNFATNTLTPATGWFINPPTVDGNPLWVSQGLFQVLGSTGTDGTVTWTAPAELVSDGTDGDDAVTSQLTNPSPIAPADNDGTNPVYTNTGGTHKVYSGATDETTNATHSVSGSATLNGLTIAVVAGTGIYSFSGASWTTDQEQFTLRANFGGVDYDKLITITKAKAEAGSARIIGIGAFAVDIALDPDNAEAALRVDSDGDVYSRQGLSSSFSSDGTYLGTGVVADYDVMFEGTGDTPTGSAVNTWLACSSDRTWTHTEGVNGNTEVFTGVLKWRDDTTFEILAEASAAVQAQVTS